ncbi:MAG: metallophosphoesterase [Pirellulaceae bacterium]
MKLESCALPVFAILAMSLSVRAQDPAFRFLATGDLPYSADQESQYRRLLKQSEGEDFQFLMHVGDFKAGSAPCSNNEFTKIRDLFQAYSKPVVYTPGDNEWTDCHSVGRDPVERLDKLRELFFKDPQTLRLGQLGAHHQSMEPQYAKYVENYRFIRSGVLFIVAHVVGSGNNYRADHPPSMTEFHGRTAANLAFLNESFAVAVARNVRAVAIVIHANPDFEKGAGVGFQQFLATMRAFLPEYRRPVICIHGDSHYFRIDKPFKDSARKTFLHFTRVEVFGSPNVAGLAVTVDPYDPQVFSYRPYYLVDK